MLPRRVADVPPTFTTTCAVTIPVPVTVPVTDIPHYRRFHSPLQRPLRTQLLNRFYPTTADTGRGFRDTTDSGSDGFWTWLLLVGLPVGSAFYIPSPPPYFSGYSS